MFSTNRKRKGKILQRRLYLATCKDQLQQDQQPHAPDDQVLIEVLQQRGIAAQAVAWNNPSVPWSGSTVILRSTWDYFSHMPAFMTWVSRFDKYREQPSLWNPPSVIRWNAHKAYLFELARRGIPILPTILLPQGSQAHLAAIMQQRHWQQAVIKPACGANAFGFSKVTGQQMSAEGQEHLDALLKSQDVLIQPFVEAISQQGEHSLVWIAGQWSHYAIGKRTTTRSTNATAGDEKVLPASRDELRLAEQTLQCALEALGMDQQELLFARTDLVRDDQGQLRLLELEMIEPILYLKHLPHLAEQLANAIEHNMQRKESISSSKLFATV
jgi:hypothetical protein